MSDRFYDYKAPYEALATNDPVAHGLEDGGDDLVFESTRDRRRRRFRALARHFVFIGLSVFLLVHVAKPFLSRHLRSSSLWSGQNDHRDHEYPVNCSALTNETLTFNFEIGLNETNSDLKLFAHDVVGEVKYFSTPLSHVLFSITVEPLEDTEGLDHMPGSRLHGASEHVAAMMEDAGSMHTGNLGQTWRRWIRKCTQHVKSGFSFASGSKKHHHHPPRLQICTLAGDDGVILSTHPWHDLGFHHRHGGHHHPHPPPPGKGRHPHPPPPPPPPPPPGKGRHPHPPPPPPPPPPPHQLPHHGDGHEDPHHHSSHGRHQRLPVARAYIGVHIPRELDPKHLRNILSVAPRLQTTVLGRALEALTLNDATFIGDAVEIQKLNVAKATVISRNALNGTFAASKELTLIADNAPIAANVTLLSDASSRREGPATGLSLIAKSGSVDALVDLVSVLDEDEDEDDEDDAIDGAFSISSVNNNHPNTVKVQSQPEKDVPSLVMLNLISRNEGGELYAELPRPWEGPFTLVTTLGGKSEAKLLEEGKEDPTGQGRKRVLELTNIIGGKVTTGKVSWTEDSDDETGDIEDDSHAKGEDEDEDEDSEDWDFAAKRDIAEDSAALAGGLWGHGPGRIGRLKKSSASLITSNADATLVFA